jgi:hypothetical protein
VPLSPSGSHRPTPPQSKCERQAWRHEPSTHSKPSVSSQLAFERHEGAGPDDVEPSSAAAPASQATPLHASGHASPTHGVLAQPPKSAIKTGVRAPKLRDVRFGIHSGSTSKNDQGTGDGLDPAPRADKLLPMRWFTLPCAVLALAGCLSRPLGDDYNEDGPAASPSDPLGSSDGNFRPLPRYPAGPYGADEGAIIENHSFLGWRDPVRAGFDPSRLEEVSLSDFYDPDGRETELIVVNASAVWCPVCRSEMRIIDTRGLAAAYRSSKVVLLGTLFEDARLNPAKPEDLALWANGLNFVVDFPLVLDPGLKLGPYFSDAATPLNLVIDARTMEILVAYMGYGETLWGFVNDELARRGVTPPGL